MRLATSLSQSVTCIALTFKLVLDFAKLVCIFSKSSVDKLVSILSQTSLTRYVRNVR